MKRWEDPEHREVPGSQQAVSGKEEINGSHAAGAKAMTEGMRQHRAFVLSCLLARAKRRAVQEVK